DRVAAREGEPELALGDGLFGGLGEVDRDWADCGGGEIHGVDRRLLGDIFDADVPEVAANEVIRVAALAAGEDAPGRVEQVADCGRAEPLGGQGVGQGGRVDRAGEKPVVTAAGREPRQQSAADDVVAGAGDHE